MNETIPLQILDPFNKLLDEGHTALAQLSNAQAEQVDEALGGASGTGRVDR